MNPDGSDVQTVVAPFPRRLAPAWSPDGTKLAYQRGNLGDIIVVNADGSGEVQLTATSVTEDSPTWSPDGTKILYRRDDGSGAVGNLYVVDATGGVPAPLTSDGRNRDPSWSPDGTKIAFSSDGPAGAGDYDIWVMNADGTNPVRVTDTPGILEQEPDWSPDGSRIVYTVFGSENQIRVMDPDGSNQALLLDHAPSNSVFQPDWSPDGTKLAYNTNNGISSMNADGTNSVVLRSCSGYCFAPAEADWQPIPVNSYPRPKGATPFQAYLVPAYEQCLSPNRTHGPSLAFQSCNPPAQESSALTVGTADANGKPSKSVSAIRFDTLVGNPATPADEADVQVTASITDVYEQGTLADYAGNVDVRTPLRITDKLNTPHPGGPGAATVSDTPLSVNVSCAATADTTIGGACALTTTLDALIPGAVPEGRRSVWGLGQVEVRDTNGNPFMRQGIFIP